MGSANHGTEPVKLSEVPSDTACRRFSDAGAVRRREELDAIPPAEIQRPDLRDDGRHPAHLIRARADQDNCRWGCGRLMTDPAGAVVDSVSDVRTHSARPGFAPGWHAWHHRTIAALPVRTETPTSFGLPDVALKRNCIVAPGAKEDQSMRFLISSG